MLGTEDNGKRALSTIEVEVKAAKPLGGGRERPGSLAGPRDDGKRALSAIEVAWQGESPLKGIWGKQVTEPWMTESALSARLELQGWAQAP